MTNQEERQVPEPPAEEGINRLPIIILTCLGIVALIVAVFSYAGKVSLLYLQADEVFSRLQQPTQSKRLVGSFFRIHGHLQAKSTQKIKGRLDWQFRIRGKSGKSLLVRYRGILPDTFKDNAELVLEGKLEHKTLFRATSVFAKCPTKYKEDDKGKKPKTS